MRSVVTALVLCVSAACANDATSTSASDAATTTAMTPPPATTTTVTPTTTTTAVAVTTVPLSTPTSIAGVQPIGFERRAAGATAPDGTVCELCLWLADTTELRQQGLMGVTDLGAGDGMVFQYLAPTTGAFWMKNTLLPLSIAFYDGTGAFLDAFDMEPCVADPCPTYQTPPDFVYTIEVRQGDLERLAMVTGSVLTLTDLPC